MTSFDKNINKIFFYWLLFTFSMVFLIVIVGGLTRLTGSGLSITEWELFVGIFPPFNLDTWNKYFLLYKQIPQYQLVNSEMSLEEFKVIYYWEYFHRMLGRLIGLFFLLPFIYFYLVKKINKKYLINCCLILFLIITQGIVGWYMVKSGLNTNVSVSHYRLSLHLSIAFIIISILFWTLINLKNKTSKSFFTRKKYNYIFYLLILLIFLQIIIGAFVSGLDAGLIYQTWPLMNLNYFPNDTNITNFFNLFDFNNRGLIQFYHRNIAYLITLYILFMGYFIFKNKVKALIKPFSYVSFFLILQIVLGVMTLISGLNIYLAAVHQICSLLLTLSAINLYYSYIN
jgi:heme a synthase